MQSQANNVAQAERIQAGFAAKNLNVEAKLLALETKMRRLQSLASSLPFTVKFQQYGQATYSVHGVTANSPLNTFFNSISFDVKPDVTNGLLIYILGSPNSLVSYLILIIVVSDIF